ncbi:MAG: RND transporter [Parvularcula sp.]
MSFLDDIPLMVLVVASLTLGLAPFSPEPHLVEKLKMLAAGTLVKPMDWFDMVMHGTPWILLLAKLIRMATVKG